MHPTEFPDHRKVDWLLTWDLHSDTVAVTEREFRAAALWVGLGRTHMLSRQRHCPAFRARQSGACALEGNMTMETCLAANGTNEAPGDPPGKIAGARKRYRPIMATAKDALDGRQLLSLVAPAAIRLHSRRPAARWAGR
jgi:hypothetical protein